MPLYRKKPVVVEAWRFTPPELTDVPDWLSVEVNAGKALMHHGPPTVITIETLEGFMTAQPGDWIIKGVKGEIYPCKPDIFAATYEPSEASAPIGRGPEVPWSSNPYKRATRFRDAMQGLINSHSRENGSDTPDFILAQFMLDSMDAFDKAVSRRSAWYSYDRRIGELELQLLSEGEHTAAGQAEIGRLQAENEKLAWELKRVSMAGIEPSTVGGS